MTLEFWQQAQGEVVARRYVIGEMLGASDASSVFRTEYNGAPAAIRLIAAKPDEATRTLARMQKALPLSHPHLLSLYDVGTEDSAGVPLVYVVMEFADDVLASALAERALTLEETREVLHSAAEALNYLHGRGFVHGRVCPAGIMACGDKIKLASDSIFAIKDGAPSLKPPYAAPEAATGQTGPSADLWALGATLSECLNPNEAPDRSAARKLPEPFRAIVAGCLDPDPEARWTAQKIEDFLKAGTPVAREATTPKTAPAQQVGPQPGANGTDRLAPASSGRSYARTWRYAMLAVAPLAVLAALLLWRKPASTPLPPKPPEPAVAVPHGKRPSPLSGRSARRTPAGSDAAHPASKRDAPKPQTRDAADAAASSRGTSALPASSRQADWRVIAYTFSRYKDAEKRARSIEQRWPEFQTEVFTPIADSRPYLVSLGKGLSRSAAERLQNKARTAGLPPDTFIRNYGK
jgi:eukaryotic-like serine/threonine-protein kinase